MERTVPNVFMLGWEFPPIINGGLGVACHDLSGAMSDLANVTMVVPKSSKGYKVKQVNLVGVNNVDVSTLEPGPPGRDWPFKLISVPADLDPYYTSHSGSFLSGVKRNASGGFDAFDIDTLYGGDVIGKVVRFSEITAAIARKHMFDVIHVHDWMTMLAGMRIKEETGKPLVMHIHSLEVDRGGTDSRGWVYDLEKAGMESADLIMPVSRFTADNIHQYYGIPYEKMHVVHNGSNSVQSFKTEKPYREKTVLFVGRLTRQKGPEKFLDIAAKVLEANPDVRFVMAGVGDNFRYMIEESSYRHIGNRFHLTGFLNTKQLHQLFSFSDVYCMPSVSEPFGLSAVEAAQFGLPCVISKQSGVAEVLHGALKFDFWDVNKAADYILNLLRDSVFAEKVVEDAQRSLGNISWDRSAREVINGYTSRQFI